MHQCRQDCHGKGGDINAHRDYIQDLYINQQRSASAVAASLRQNHGISHSVPSLKKKLRRWHILKGPSVRKKRPGESTTTPADMQLGQLLSAVNREVPTSLSAPTSLGLAEGMFYSMRHFTTVRLVDWNRDREYRLSDLFYEAFTAFVLVYGQNTGSLSPARRGALLELGFRSLDRILRVDSHVLSHAVLVLLGVSRYNNAGRDIEQMLIRQTAATTAIVFPKYHPARIFARNMLQTPLSDEALETLFQANGDVFDEVLGKDDPYTLLAKVLYSSCAFNMRKSRMTNEEIIENHKTRCAKFKGHEQELYHTTIMHEGYSRDLLKFGMYEEAVELCGDAPKHLQQCLEWRAQGNEDDDYNCPVSLENCLTRMAFLARGLTGQGKLLVAADKSAQTAIAAQQKYDEARDLLVTAISASVTAYGDANPQTMVLRSEFIWYLNQLGLAEEEKTTYEKLDESLSDFVLMSTTQLDALTP